MKQEDLLRMALNQQGQAQGMPPQEQQIPIGPEDLEDITCKECGHEKFDMALLMKRLSPLHPKNVLRQEHFFPVRIVVCKNCGAELKGVVI
jgi:hypothetical protein